MLGIQGQPVHIELISHVLLVDQWYLVSLLDFSD